MDETNNLMQNINGKVREIQTKHGKVRVNEDIYDRIKQLGALVYKHHGRYYVKYKEQGKAKEIALTAFITGKSGREHNVGFKDHDYSNCSRSNLVLCNKGVKKKITKKFFGVNKNRNRYQVRISRNGTRINVITVGTYIDEITAAIAYNKAMDVVYGEGNYVKNELDISKDLYQKIYEEVSIDLAERTSRQGTNQKLDGATSIYTGVCKAIDYGVWKGKWIANIFYKSANIYLGRFESEELAAQAYNQVAIHLYGENARLNPVPKPMHNVVIWDSVNKKIELLNNKE